MGRTAEKLSDLFRGPGQPTADELAAAHAGTALLRPAIENDQLLDGLDALGQLLARQADPDPKRRTALQTLLASRKLDERLAGARRLRDELARRFLGDAELPDPALVKAALDRLGPAVLKLDSEIGPAYQRYLQRRTPAQSPMSFERWLRKTEATRVRQRLKVLGLDAWRRGLHPSTALHVPATALLRLDAGTLTAMCSQVHEMGPLIERLAGVKIEDAVLRQLILDKLGRKVGPLLAGDAQAREQVLALFRPGGLSLEVPVTRPKVFLRGDLSNLQGNLGELFALPAQIQRLARLQAAGRGQRIVLATDVRFAGSKLVPGATGTPAARPARGAEPPSQPMAERELAGLEYADDLIIDLGAPPVLRVLEHHENKVTQASIEDALTQIDDNAERVAFAASLSFGRLYELVDGRLLPLDPARLRLPATAAAQGWVVAGGRLSVSESPQARERLAAIQHGLQQQLDALDADTGLDAAGRVQAAAALMRRASAAEREHQRLVGLHASQKVVFAPQGQPARVPEQVALQPLGFSYEAFVSLCNLLLVHGPFQRTLT